MNKSSLLRALRIIATAAEDAEDDGLRKLFAAYNYLSRQFDGTTLPYPQRPTYNFRYDKSTQTVTLESTT